MDIYWLWVKQAPQSIEFTQTNCAMKFSLTTVAAELLIPQNAIELVPIDAYVCKNWKHNETYNLIEFVNTQKYPYMTFIWLLIWELVKFTPTCSKSMKKENNFFFTHLIISKSEGKVCQRITSI